MTPPSGPDREHRRAPTTVVEVFADVSCPFAHVGLRVSSNTGRWCRRDDLVLRVRAWPLELVNGSPLDPAIDRDTCRRSSASRSHPISSAASTLDAFPESSLDALGTGGGRLSKPAIASENGSAWRCAMPSSKRAATSVTRGTPSDRGRTGHRGSRPGCGRPVIADWEEGKRRGVRGSPEFFVKGRGYFCPTLDITRVGGQLAHRP